MCWHSSLTKEQTQSLEKVQRRALQSIVGDISYDSVPLNSGVAEQNLTKFFTRCSQIITDESVNQKCDIAIRLAMPRRRMKVIRPISPI